MSVAELVGLPRYSRLLANYLRPQWLSVAMLALLLIATSVLQLLAPQALRYFIDATQAGATQAALLAAAGLYVVAGLGQRMLALGTVYLSERVGWTATNRLRADLARHCLRLDMGFHKQYTPGELIERIDGDVTALGNFFSAFAINLIGNGILLLALLGLLFAEDWRAGALMTVYAIVAFVLLSTVQQIGVRRWEAEREASAAQFSFLEERMNGTEDIRAAGAESHTLGQLDHLLDPLLRKNRSARLAGNITFTITNFLFVFGYALGLMLGAMLYLSGNGSIGTAFLIVFYVGMLAQPLEHIREQLQDLQRATASIDRVGALFRLQPLVVDRPAVRLPSGPLAVEFEHVSFAYNDAIGEAVDATVAESQAVLHDLSLCLEPGTVLGLLGRTGSGKTTMTRLLLRLYDPAHGVVRIGGCDIREVALAELRARVGMVMQDVQLFNASIRTNLTLFSPRINDAAIESALRELGLWQWVSQLPHGLDTRLGAGGIGLSAGEAQLLAFARVFLRDPGLVILDEASSRLDPATERLLESAVDRLLVGRTAIVIAHRLSTVQRADQILILADGAVAEYGAYATLASDPTSQFARLLQVGMAEVLA